MIILLVLLFYSFVTFAATGRNYFVITRNYNNVKYILLEGHLNGLQLPLKSSLLLESKDIVLKTAVYVPGTLDFIESDLSALELENTAVNKPETCLFRRWLQLPLPNEAIVNNCKFLTVNDEHTMERTFLYSQQLYALLKHSNFTDLLVAESPTIVANDEMDVRQPPVPKLPQQHFSTFVGMLPVRMYHGQYYALLEKKDDGLGVFSLEAPVDRIDSLFNFIELAAKSVYPFTFPYVGDEPYFMNRNVRYAVLSREAQEVIEDSTRLWTGQFVLIERIDQAGLFPLAQREHLWLSLKDLLQFATDKSGKVRGFSTTKNDKSKKYEEKFVVYNVEDEGEIELGPALIDMLTSPLNQEILETRFFPVIEECGKEFGELKVAPLVILTALSFFFGILIPIVLFYQRKN